MKIFLTNEHLLKYLLLVFVFLIFLVFFIDQDFGWHLAMGERFLETGEILRTDIFSFSMPGYSWGNSYFLYQAVIALLYKFLGYKFLVILFAAIPTSAVFLLLKRVDLIKFAAILLGAKLAITNLAVKPHTVSFMFFAVLILFLEKQFYVKKRHVLLWFALFVLWANVHRAFAVGLVVFFFYLTVDYLYKRSFIKKTNIVIPVYCVLAALLGTFLTPFGLDLYKSGVANDFLTFENLRYIAEWQPVVVYFPNNIYFLASGIIFIYIFLTNAKKQSPAWFLIGAFLFSLAFISANFVFFWCALFIFIASKYLSSGIKNRLAERIVFVLGLGFVVIICLTIGLKIKTNVMSSPGLMLDKSGYPVEAVKYMRENSLRSNLLAQYNWGGFIDWQYPQAKIFIDGRMAGWKTPEGKSILGAYIDLKSGKCDSLKVYRVETLLVSKAFDLSCFGNFREVYRDDRAKVLVKRED